MKIARGASDVEMYDVVRLDDGRTLPGIIIEADEDTGKVAMLAPDPEAPGEVKEFKYDLGPRGCRIVPRAGVRKW